MTNTTNTTDEGGRWGEPDHYCDTTKASVAADIAWFNAVAAVFNGDAVKIDGLSNDEE